LTITAAGGADAGTYSIIVSNAMGAATNFAVVTILDPVVTTQPTNQLVAPGATAHFSVVAAGTPTLRYQWQRDGTNLANGGNISGATTAALTVSSVSDADVAAYSCLVTNGLGNSTVSSNATVALVDPGFVLQPHDVTTNYSATVVLSAAAVGTATAFLPMAEGRR
jgi:large repetitive protein